MKNYLCVFCFLFLSINLSASNITKPVPVKIEKKRTYDSCPYAGVVIAIPTVGVGFRDKAFTHEYGVKVSSIGFVSAASVTAAKLVPLNIPFDKNDKYTGVYLEAGVGAGVIAIMNTGNCNQPIYYEPLVHGDFFIGYQARYGFIDAGMEVVPRFGDSLVLPLPVLRCGLRF